MEDPSAAQAIRVVALSIAPDTVTASLTADSLNLPYGTSTHLIGKFTLPDKTPAAGIPVHLQTQANGGAWTKVDGVTSSDGTYEATLQLTQTTKVQMFTDGTWQRLEGDTPIVVVNVARLLTWTIPASMKVGVSYPITAQVTPADAGVTVTLNNGATAVTDVSGKATFAVTNDLTGFTQYQLSIASDPIFAGVQTGFVTVWLR